MRTFTAMVALPLLALPRLAYAWADVGDRSGGLRRLPQSIAASFRGERKGEREQVKAAIDSLQPKEMADVGFRCV